jgi:hypothetical protein
MFCVLVLIMPIDVVVEVIGLVIPMVPVPLLLYKRG